MAKKGYYIVDFLSTNETDLVPGNWLVKRGAKLFCYFPPKNTKDIAAKVKKGNSTSPLSTWGLYEVKVVKNLVFADYHEGRKKLGKVEFANSSDLNSEVEVLNRMRKRHFNDARVMACDTNRLPSPPKLRVTATTSVPAERSPSPVASSRSTSFRSSSVTSLESNQQDNLPSPGPSRPPRNPTSQPCCHQHADWQKQVDRKLAIILNNQVDIKEMLDVLTSRPTTANLPDQNETLIELFSAFPLQTEDALTSLENSLEEDRSLKNKLISFLKQQGGHSPGDAVRRLLRVVFTDQLAAHHTWAGSRGKPKLSNLRVVSAMFCAIKKMPGMAETSNRVLEDAMKDWLRRASDRLRIKAKKQSAEVVLDSDSDASVTGIVAESVTAIVADKE